MVTPVDKVLGELIGHARYNSTTHDQVVEVIGLVPGWAVPVRLKLVVRLLDPRIWIDRDQRRQWAR